MGIIATAVKHLIAAGLSGDDLVRAIEEMEATQPEPAKERTRTAAAIRQQNYRERHKPSQNVTGDAVSQSITKPSPVTLVTSRDVTGDAPAAENPSPDKSPQTPKINPTPQAHTRAREGTRLPVAFELPDDWRDFAVSDRNWTEAEVRREFDEFRDYWIGKPGKDGRKSDWAATWRNWVRKSRRPSGRVGAGQLAFPAAGGKRGGEELDALTRQALAYR